MRGLACIVMMFFAMACSAQTADTAHVFFRTDDPFLNTAAEKAVDKFTKKIAGEVRVLVIGYADHRGDTYYNDMLAMRRAQNVAARLEHNGVDKKNIKLVTGRGEVYRKVEQREGYAEDRRVDIVVSSGSIPPSAPRVVPKPVVKEEPKIVKKDTIVSPPKVISAENIDDVEVGQSLKIPNLYFLPGRAVIKSGSERALDDLFKILRTHPTMKVRIEGHICCSPFDDEDGMDHATGKFNLSEARARVVYEELIRSGIAEDRLSYKGLARTMPVTLDESTQELADLNRRVEIRIMEK